MTFNSLFNKNPLFCWSLLLQTVPNKNRFSPVCSYAVFLLKRVCRVTVHSDPALCRLAYTAHTRLKRTLRSGKHPLRPTAYSSPGYIDSFWPQWLSETVCNQLQTKDGVPPTFTYKNIYVPTQIFPLHWHSKSHV